MLRLILEVWRSFVDLASDWYSAWVPAIICAKSYFIGPDYNGTRLSSSTDSCDLFPIFFKVSSLALGQLFDCSSGNEVTMKDLVKIGCYRRWVDSPHKEQVMLKMFPCHELIMMIVWFFTRDHCWGVHLPSQDRRGSDRIRRQQVRLVPYHDSQTVGCAHRQRGYLHCDEPPDHAEDMWRQVLSARFAVLPGSPTGWHYQSEQGNGEEGNHISVLHWSFIC